MLCDWVSIYAGVCMPGNERKIHIHPYAEGKEVIGEVTRDNCLQSPPGDKTSPAPKRSGLLMVVGWSGLGLWWQQHCSNPPLFPGKDHHPEDSELSLQPSLLQSL